MDELPEFALIINCCPEIGQLPYSNDTEEIIKLKFHDDVHDNNKLIQLLESGNILQRIHNSIINKKPVLVHCAMGIQRSAAIIACYLIKYYNIGIDKTILYIKYKRPEAFSTGNTFEPAMHHYNNK
jgi:protein-tyrosine phosphatase